jgi:hypothetical protein
MMLMQLSERKYTMGVGQPDSLNSETRSEVPFSARSTARYIGERRCPYDHAHSVETTGYEEM